MATSFRYGCSECYTNEKANKIAPSSVQLFIKSALKPVHFHKTNHISSISKSPPLSVLLLIEEKDMNKKLTSWLFSSFLLAAPLSLQAQYHSQVWNPDNGTKEIGKPRIVFDGGQKNHTTEGPKFYKRDGYYWIMCPAGGVQMGWQLAMRSKNVYGPYEAKMVMAQGKTKINGPHQGAWVHTSQGEDWFLHFNDKYAYGRVIFLQPVNWKTGWPVMGQDKDGDGCGEPYLTYRMPKSTSHTKVNPQESDEFNSTELGLQWQWHANYNQLWGMPTNNGCMRLYTADLTATDKAGKPQPFKSLWEAGNLLLQKTPAENFTATAKIRFASKEDDQYGGIIMMGMNYQALVVRRMGDKFLLQQLYCKGADTGGIETEKTLATLKPTEMDTIPYSPAIYLDIYLQMKVKAGKCQFAYSLDGKRYKDAGDLFTLRQGKWIGAKMGFVSERKNTLGNRGWIDADWFRVTK